MKIRERGLSTGENLYKLYYARKLINSKQIKIIFCVGINQKHSAMKYPSIHSVRN